MGNKWKPVFYRPSDVSDLKCDAETFARCQNLLQSVRGVYTPREFQYQQDMIRKGLVYEHAVLELASHIELAAIRRGRTKYFFAKFVFDTVASLLLLFAMSPLLFAFGALIKLTSPGPVFFRQMRFGLHRRPFLIFKFRTMNNSSQVTRIGRLLRKFKLDELPQLFNVVKGEMSLVGPRPLSMLDSVAAHSGYNLRFAVRPGMTGLWQATVQNTTALEEKLRLDVDYVLRAGFLYDLKLMLMTIPMITGGEHAIKQRDPPTSQKAA